MIGTQCLALERMPLLWMPRTTGPPITAPRNGSSCARIAAPVRAARGGWGWGGHGDGQGGAAPR